MDALRVQAATHFQSRLWSLVADPPGPEGRTHLAVSGPLGEGEFLVTARAATSADQERARRAEALGRAAGMAGLAARCKTVLVIEPLRETPDRVMLELCAVCAATVLGPILPPDDSTLLGVRSARERAARP